MLTGTSSAVTFTGTLKGSTPTISAVGDPLLDGELKAFAVRKVEIRITGEVTPNTVASLYDATGKLILTRKLDEGSLNVIPTPGFKSGLYVLKVIYIVLINNMMCIPDRFPKPVRYHGKWTRFRQGGNLGG